MIRRLVAALVPEHDRDAVLGDLHEELPPGGARMAARRLFALMGIALHYEVEPYVGDTGAREPLGLLAAGLGLMWAAGAAGATWSGAEPPPGYDPVSRALLELWASPYALGLLSALAAGLLAGRAGHGSGTARRHVVLALSALAFLSAPVRVVGAMTAGLCIAGAWLGSAARREDGPERTCALR